MLKRSPEWYALRLDQMRRSQAKVDQKAKADRLKDEKIEKKIEKQKRKRKPTYRTYINDGGPKVWKNWKKYSMIARRIVAEMDLSGIPNIELRDGTNYQLDHIVSVWDGFKNNIALSLISSHSNLRIISREENMKKGTRSNVELLAKMVEQNKLYQK